MKKMQLQETDKGTYDLIIERDSGNDVLILMPRNQVKCMEEWIRLRDLAIQAVDELINNQLIQQSLVTK